MEKVNYLPKGHEVLFIVIPEEYGISLEKAKQMINSVNITYTEDDSKLYIKAFIAGDTEEKGISVVALDNPKYCVLSWRRTDTINKVREMLRRGWFSSIELDRVVGSRHIRGYANCPY